MLCVLPRTLDRVHKLKPQHATQDCLNESVLLISLALSPSPPPFLSLHARTLQLPTGGHKPETSRDQIHCELRGPASRGPVAPADGATAERTGVVLLESFVWVFLLEAFPFREAEGNSAEMMLCRLNRGCCPKARASEAPCKPPLRSPTFATWYTKKATKDSTPYGYVGLFRFVLCRDCEDPKPKPKPNKPQCTTGDSCVSLPLPHPTNQSKGKNP